MLPWWSWLISGAAVGDTAHEMLYYTVRRYRMWAEVQAYREQMRYPDRHGEHLSLGGAVARLADSQLYRLGITVEQALEVLLRY